MAKPCLRHARSGGGAGRLDERNTPPSIEPNDMSLKQFITAPSEPLIDYTSMRALIVDDYPGMRSAFKMSLSNFGVSRIDLATNASDAIFRLKNSKYDIIICDYNLGDGRDGQQLLEEVRHRGLLGLETAFIMVTAESLYEKVVATAELAPDDYLIKPFSGEILRNRLDVILQRKRAFGRVYKAFAAGELDEAMAACDEIISQKPRYVVDSLRFKGELLNALGRFDDAEALYKRVIEMRAVPWARLGLAKSLHLQQDEAQAEEILEDVIQEVPEMVSAYDLLADVRIARKDTQGAQEALKKGTEISAKTVRRQQRLGEVAVQNGDLDTARNAYSTAIDKGKHSIFVDGDDYANLCRVQVEQGDLKAAMQTLKSGKTAFQENPEGQMTAAIMESVVQTKAGQPDSAKRALDEAARLHASGVRADDKQMLDLAETFMANGRHEECDAIISEVAKNAHDSESLLSKARKIYADAGRADAGAQVLSQATDAVRKLNNEGVMLAQKGRLAEAVEKVLNANREAPFNPRIAMNAAWIVLRHIEENGLEHDLLQEAKRLIDAAADMAPSHGRIPGLRGKLRDLETRFGILR